MVQTTLLLDVSVDSETWKSLEPSMYGSNGPVVP